MSKVIIASGGIVLLIILGIYFARTDSLEDLNTKKEQLESDLTVAQNKLEKEKNQLEDMKIGLRDSFTLAIGVQDQMKKASSIVRQTDFMFIDPNGLDPQLKIANPFSNILINEDRKKINQIVSEWQDKLDIFSVRKIDLKESEKIKKDIEVIKKFIQDLSVIVNKLTTENSGLSQDQIDAYILRLPSFVEINQVLISVGFSIDSADSKDSDNPPIPTEENTETDTETSNQYSFDPDDYEVTPEEVVAKQEVVDRVQEEIKQIQAQLEVVEEQIQELSSVSTPAPSPVLPPVETVVVPETVTPSPNEGGDNINNSPGVYFPRKFTPAQGIIIQPGPPRLIPGVDDY